MGRKDMGFNPQFPPLDSGSGAGMTDMEGLPSWELRKRVEEWRKTGDYKEPVSEVATKSLSSFVHNGIRGNSISPSRISQHLWIWLRLSSRPFAADRRTETFETGSEGRPYGKRGWRGMMLEGDGRFANRPYQNGRGEE